MPSTAPGTQNDMDWISDRAFLGEELCGYLEDLSLSEIALNENVSRSAIQRAIKDGEKELSHYEEKVGLLKKTCHLSLLLGKIEKEKDDEKRKDLLREAKGVLDYGI